MWIGSVRQISAFSLLAVALITPASAEKNYGPGVTDTEIKIGQTMPYLAPSVRYSTKEIQCRDGLAGGPAVRHGIHLRSNVKHGRTENWGHRP
jgi:hypothetical protein